MGSLKGTLFCLVVFVVTVTSRKSRDSSYHQAGYAASRSRETSNSCTVYKEGCQYQLTLASTDCMSQDSPMTPDFNHIIKSKTQHEKEKNPEDGVTLKKFDELENKLTKLMEGLSIRSLRHIRQIKTDLRTMSNTMNLLKMKAGGKKGKNRMQCPEEFVSVGTWSSCYRFSTFNATWAEAREYCSAFGSNLVSLDTMKEAYILDYLIKSDPAYQGPKGWWTSGNYIVRNRKWMWTSRHHIIPINFSRWAPNEPDARSTMHCMILYKDAAYHWHDAMCTDNHTFICEIEII